MEPIIALDHVTFSYQRSAEPALSDVSLAIEPGAFVGVIGPSGAGKSTLAAALSGAIPHHHRGALYGAVRIAGRDTCEITLTDIAQTVGSVGQDIDAQMVASVVEDELLFGLENFGVPREQITRRIDEALATTGIRELRERQIATLSGGQKQKVAIAAILALQPRVLVMDEPASALDPASARLVFETLRDINERYGVTVVVIEQMVALLSEYCDRILVMDGGGVALDGAPREVFAHAAELRRIGVDCPRVTRVYNSLVERGLVRDARPCLDVPEAVALVEQIASENMNRLEPAKTAARGAGSPGDRAAHGAPASAPSPVILRVEDASFAYPGGSSVHGLCLEARGGQIVGVVGQNGAGKTTLTKLVSGLLKPDVGRVIVAGMDTRRTPVSHIARHAATLFQNPDRQICRETVRDEIAFGLELRGVPAADARMRAEAAAERFGLDADRAPFALSRGQRQLVALASVVVLEPDLVILDEPTSGLDYRECMTVMQTVRELADGGSAVLMVCHDMEVVSDFADRLVVMANGGIIGEGAAREVFSDATLLEAASIAAPQVYALSSALAACVSPRFAHITEVSDIVTACEELIQHD